MKRSSLNRYARLQSRSKVKSAKSQQRTTPEPSEKEVRASVRTRAGGMCEARIPSVCLGQGSNYHHRLNRSQGGDYTVPGGLLLCGSGTTGCHGYITDHPAISYDRGWSVRRGQNPAAVPVYLSPWGWPIWVYLSDDGNYLPLSPDQVLDLGVKVA